MPKTKRGQTGQGSQKQRDSQPGDQSSKNRNKQQDQKPQDQRDER